MFATRILLSMVLGAALAACSGDAAPAEDDGDLAAFCSLGARIGDTSVLTDVDSSDPATFERTYDETVATLAEMIPVAPASAEAQVRAGHDLLVEFRAELEAAEWSPPDLPVETATRWINLSSELIEVSPSIRAACG